MGENKDVDIVWVTQAMVEYGHSRDWFTARIKKGDLQTFPQPGSTKVYLSRREIEQAEKKDS